MEKAKFWCKKEHNKHISLRSSKDYGTIYLKYRINLEFDIL